MKHYFAQYFCLLRCQCPPLARGIPWEGSARPPFWAICVYSYESETHLSRLVAYLQVWWIFIPFGRLSVWACLTFIIRYLVLNLSLYLFSGPLWIVFLDCGCFWCNFIMPPQTHAFLFIVFFPLPSAWHLFILVTYSVSFSVSIALFFILFLFFCCLVGEFININEFCSMKVKLKFTSVYFYKGSEGIGALWARLSCLAWLVCFSDDGKPR